MRKSIEWMKTHPLVSFFILTLILLNILLIPAYYLYQRASQTKLSCRS